MPQIAQIKYKEKYNYTNLKKQNADDADSACAGL